ncbi:MAG: S41 family peptidase [Deltaproteobacteria bacterium]|nr:S41 family peptidase [Deltaproteobacteria bacterium]MBN2686651.1 S41 family peptidase [Deltaproteobacteria bacterium]
MEAFMKRKVLINAGIPIFLATLLIISILLISSVTKTATAENRDIYDNLKLFNEALDLIEKNYVEEIDPAVIIEGAIKGMTRALDPHSTYMNAEMYKELQVDTKGAFGGLGIEISIQDDIITVVSPIEDTPAYEAGIKAQDQIVAIEGESTKGFSLFDAVQKLRGPKGTNVTISIMREGFEKPKDFTITRDIIKIISVKHRLLENRIGVIRIASFHENTSDETKKALRKLNTEKEPMKGLIIDVRNNPGGLLDQAIKVSDIFLKKGVVVSTKGRRSAADKTYQATDDGDEPTCPIIVLINRGSASASEIVAGALRDNKRALLLGTQTFGKGSVQIVIPLGDGSALKLTTAKYYTPDGTSIQAKGITPDIDVEHVKQNNDNGVKAIGERDLKGHLKAEEEENEGVDTSGEERLLQNDNQLKRAVDLLRSWELFQLIKKG